MATGNEEFRDAMVRHQIALLRLSGSINQRIIQLLDATEKDIRATIERMLEDIVTPGGVDMARARTLTRLDNLQRSIYEIRQGAVREALDEWTNQFRALMVAETGITSAHLINASPVILDILTPSPALLRSLVTTLPFQGQIMKDWAQQLLDADVQRIMNEIRIGMVQGQSTREIARRIVGTAMLDGADGTTQITRNQAAAITRTAISAFSNAAREEFFTQNASIFEEEAFVATLDSRTTLQCASLDGQTFKVGEGPKPPLHWNCRSLRVAFMSAALVGTRPMKPTTEKMLLKEFTEQEGLDKVSSRDDLPYGMKGKFDEFARRRVRELVGPVPASTSFSKFLKSQSAEFQTEYLGKTRADLFRKGELELDRFVNPKGQPWTLEQLVLRESEAFKKAGLNPSDFL